MLQNIHYLSLAVLHSARFSQREYENVVGRRCGGTTDGGPICENGRKDDTAGIAFHPTVRTPTVRYNVQCRTTVSTLMVQQYTV